jgi:hypothetical protein
MTPDDQAAVARLRTLFANTSPIATVLAVGLNPQGMADLRRVLDLVDPPVKVVPLKRPGLGLRCTGTLTAAPTT